MKKTWRQRWEECDPTRKGGVALVGISLLLLGVTWVFHIINQDFFQHAYEVEGRIVSITHKDFPAGEHSPPTTVFYPTFTFATVGGTSHTIQTQGGMSIPLFKTGDRVTVLYEPTHPEDAEIKHTSESWEIRFLWYALIATLLVAGLICIFFGEKLLDLGSRKDNY